MARENKQAREERRFGKPERLADLILASEDRKQWLIAPWALQGASTEMLDYYWDTVCKIRHALISCKVIDVTNGCRIYWDHPQDVWLHSDFPSVAPPFPEFFMEASHPGTITIEGGRRAEPAKWCPARWGFLFTSYETPDGDVMPVPNEEKGIAGEKFDCAWSVQILLVMQQDKRCCFFPMIAFMAVDALGNMMAWPTVMGGGIGLSEDDRAQIGSIWTSLIKPIFFGLSMVHCKNVVLQANEPDRRLNRERRDAGLKPFVRYHTINIEPMKKVLRTEGNSETEGLKRAMHICRGHFARYSEERPLFGRIAGTFWVPAHVRGSLKEGVVVSDYRVNAPAPAGKQ
jgi:hypothetical protein